ncbi:2-oxo acid dehydrogenase subunit E2 [Catenulispora yoronensis]|uniref:Dihydrolipoyllysine-residue succinyltransferase component of 2-oxoglutarate dehydrogenase complex n=1 Tax=Catenulispora yoronensis TaxID=450799 RepID=A0ABN2TKR7_9ACTN
MKEPDVARERRHTLYFLREIKDHSPVFLDTEVDMSRVLQLRAEGHARDRHYSTVSFVLLAAARAIAKHPAANAAARGGKRLKVLRFEEISGKLTLDKTVNGERVVLSVVLPGLADATLEDVQRKVDRYQTGDGEVLPEFAGARALHGLPRPIGAALFRRAVRPLAKRPAITGTFAVTSLGHRPVDGFYSVGGTTVTIGVGRITDRPVVRDGQVVIAPVVRLSLTFDHRVIDGAEAADLLADLKTALEEFPAPADGPAPAAATADRTEAAAR